MSGGGEVVVVGLLPLQRCTSCFRHGHARPGAMMQEAALQQRRRAGRGRSPDGGAAPLALGAGHGFVVRAAGALWARLAGALGAVGAAHGVAAQAEVLQVQALQGVEGAGQPVCQDVGMVSGEGGGARPGLHCVQHMHPPLESKNTHTHTHSEALRGHHPASRPGSPRSRWGRPAVASPPRSPCRWSSGSRRSIAGSRPCSNSPCREDRKKGRSVIQERRTMIWW